MSGERVSRLEVRGQRIDRREHQLAGGLFCSEAGTGDRGERLAVVDPGAEHIDISGADCLGDFGHFGETCRAIRHHLSAGPVPRAALALQLHLGEQPGVGGGAQGVELLHGLQADAGALLRLPYQPGIVAEAGDLGPAPRTTRGDGTLAGRGGEIGDHAQIGELLLLVLLLRLEAALSLDGQPCFPL